MKGVFKKSGEKIGVRVTIIAFVILIFVPSIAWWFLGALYGEDRSENRILAKQPTFDIRMVEKFPKEFDAFWNDHAPFRRGFREAWNKLNLDIFKDMNSEKVVLGKSDSAFNESWLFYMGDNKKVSPISDTQGVSAYSDDQIEEILSDIEGKRNL